MILLSLSIFYSTWRVQIYFRPLSLVRFTGPLKSETTPTHSCDWKSVIVVFGPFYGRGGRVGGCVYHFPRSVTNFYPSTTTPSTLDLLRWSLPTQKTKLGNGTPVDVGAPCRTSDFETIFRTTERSSICPNGLTLSS